MDHLAGIFYEINYLTAWRSAASGASHVALSRKRGAPLGGLQRLVRRPSGATSSAQVNDVPGNQLRLVRDEVCDNAGHLIRIDNVDQI